MQLTLAQLAEMDTRFICVPNDGGFSAKLGEGEQKTLQVFGELVVSSSDESVLPLRIYQGGGSAEVLHVHPSRGELEFGGGSAGSKHAELNREGRRIILHRFPFKQ